MAKEIKYNSKDVAIVEALKANPDGLTLSELTEATGIKLSPGNIVAAKNKGLVESTGEKRIFRDGEKPVESYRFVTADPQKNADGKEFNYTDGEKEILATAVNMEGAFTLKQLAAAMGKDRLYTGSISGLTKKGNIVKTGEKVNEPCKIPATVKVYVLVSEIPSDAVIAE